MSIVLPHPEREVGLTGRGTAVRGDPSAASQGGANLAAAGARIAATAESWAEDFATKARQQQERAAAVETAKVYAQTSMDWDGHLREAQDQAPEGAPDFAKGVLDRFDSDARARVAAAPESARPWLETRLADLRSHVGERAMTFEAGQRLAKQSRDLSGIVDLGANRVRTDFGRLDDAIGTAESAIAASSLAPAAKTAAIAKARETIAVSGLQGLNETDPARARQMLESGQFDAHLGPDRKHMLVNDNYVELRRREAEAEQRRRLAEADHRARVADLRQEAQYAMTALDGGVVYAGLPDLVRRADGVDPKIAASLRTAHENLSWTTNLMKMDPGAITTEIERARASATAADNPALAANLAHRVDTGARVLKIVVGQLQQDSLGWAEAQGVVPRTDLLGVIRAASGEKDEASRAQAIQGAVQARTRAVAATKARYGIDVPFLRPAEADAMVRAFDAASTPDDKFGVLATLLHLPDDQARTAVAQLEAAKLPAKALHALDVARADPMRVPVARRLLAELTTPAAKVNLTDADEKLVRTEARTAYQGGIGRVLGKAYALTGNPGYEARVQSDVGALEHVVKTRTAGGLDDPARSAYGDLYGHLAVLDVDRFAHVVVPKGADTGKLELGLAYLRATEAPKLMEAERPSNDPVAVRQWEAASLGAVAQAGTWVNAGSGFALIRPGSGKALDGADGLPRVWTLEEIQAAADAAKAAKFKMRSSWNYDSWVNG